MSNLLKSLITASLLTTTAAYAESMPTNKNARVKVGLNASFNQYAYDQNNDVTVMPQAFYDNNRVYIEGAEAGAYVYKDAQNEWRATLGYDSRAFDPKEAENNQLQGLDEREWSALVGTSYMRITPYGGFKAQVETDVLGRHEGTTAKLSHLSRFKLMDDKLTVYPELGVQWVDDKYNNYYFGVSNAESARTGIAAYQPDSSINPFVNVSASYNLTPRWSGFVSQHLAYLSDAQHDSPLVDNRMDSKTKVGFNYQF